MDRAVTRTGKDTDGDITALCSGPGGWGRVTKSTAIAEINVGTNTYFVNEAGYRADVKVRTRSNGVRYLTTEADKTSKNNLDNLDGC